MLFGNRDEMILECGWWDGQILAGQLSEVDVQKGRDRQAFLRTALQWPPTYVIPNYNPTPTLAPDPVVEVPTDGGEQIEFPIDPTKLPAVESSAEPLSSTPAVISE